MAAVPSVADFKAAYTEFSNAPDAVVQAKLDIAVARTDSTVWGDNYQLGVMLRTADLLAKTPEGRRMRLVDKDGHSIYHADLQTLVRRVACGVGRVT